MNKHKKNLEALRRHLGRDAAGVNLLDQTARDINELRKRVASLVESEGKAMAIAARAKEEEANAQAELSKEKAGLEKEKGRRAAAEVRAATDARRVAEMEQDAEVEDEAPLEGVAGRDRRALEITKLFKAVRKRFKKIPAPPACGRQILYLGDVAPNLTSDELLGLGMLFAALSLHGFPSPSLHAERTIKDVNGWTDANSAKFIHWYKDWIRQTATEEKILGILGRHVTEAKPW